MHELDNVVFTTKSVMLTDKQKDMISDLLDQLCDLGCDEFDNIEYQKLTPQLVDRNRQRKKSLKSWLLYNRTNSAM